MPQTSSKPAFYRKTRVTNMVIGNERATFLESGAKIRFLSGFVAPTRHSEEPFIANASEDSGCL
jgi:hypothetical protein